MKREVLLLAAGFLLGSVVITRGGKEVVERKKEEKTERVIEVKREERASGTVVASEKKLGEVRKTRKTVKRADGTQIVVEKETRVLPSETRIEMQSQMEASVVLKSDEKREVKESERITRETSLSQYSLGLSWDAKDAVRGQWQRPSVELGLRLGDLPVFATASVKIPSTAEGWSGQIGVRVEW